MRKDGEPTGQKYKLRVNTASAIWAGYYEGNERSHRVQEKLGFEFRYRRECDVELLGERRVECCQLLVPERVR